MDKFVSALVIRERVAENGLLVFPNGEFRRRTFPGDVSADERHVVFHRCSWAEGHAPPFPIETQSPESSCSLRVVEPANI